MSLHKYTETINIRVLLGGHGDALIHGYYNEHSYASGLSIKQSMFAWHEASFYGTELAMHQVEGLEFVVLPAEMVIPFFAERKLLQHIEWVWRDIAERLIML